MSTLAAALWSRLLQQESLEGVGRQNGEESAHRHGDHGTLSSTLQPTMRNNMHRQT